MNESDELRARWSTEPLAAVRRHVLARGGIVTAAKPDGPWKGDWEHDLRGIDLSQCTLVGVDLSWLDEANLVRATLIRCRLNSASLSGADLSEVRMSEGEASCCGGTGVVLDAVRSSSMDFGCATFRESSFPAATFVDDDWTSSRFFGCDLRRTHFVRCKLNGARFTGAVLDGAVFEDCDLGME